MNPGRPKQLTGAGVPLGQPAMEAVVRAHSDQLVKLNTELSSAFAQVTGEMGDLRTSATSTSTVLAALSSQVAALTDLVTRLLPARAGESNPTPPAAPPTAPPPVAPPDQHLDPRWEPTLSPPNAYVGEFDRSTGRILGWSETCHATCLHSAPSPSSGARPTPPSPDLSGVPSAYHDLARVFSKYQALSLPPHRPYDCAIDLLPGAPLPVGRLYNLSIPEIIFLSRWPQASYGRPPPR